jgi:predicted PurR-regulated permease PerM
LWLGGWFWGVAGIVIAVPTLLCLKVVAQHSRLGGTLTEFLSPEEPTAEWRLTAKQPVQRIE